MSTTPPLPNGYQLEKAQGSIPDLPSGYKLAQTGNTPPLPDGYKINAPQPTDDLTDMMGHGMPSEQDLNPTADQHPVAASALRRAGNIVKGTLETIFKPPEGKAETSSMLLGPLGPMVTRLVRGQVAAEKQLAPQLQKQVAEARATHAGQPPVTASDFMANPVAAANRSFNLRDARAVNTAAAMVNPLASGSVANVNQLQDEGKPEQATGEGITDALALGTGLPGPSKVISGVVKDSVTGLKRGPASVPRSTLSKTIKPADPVEFHAAEQSAIPKVKQAALESGQPVKSASDLLTSVDPKTGVTKLGLIDKAKQNLLLDAHEAAGPGKTIADLPPEDLGNLQKDMSALDTLDQHIKAAQEAAVKAKPQPTASESIGQIVKGGAKVAVGAAVSPIPVVGNAAGVLGLFKGTPEMVSGVKNLLAKRALTAENLDAAVQQTFGGIEPAPRLNVAPADVPGKPAFQPASDLSVQHEGNVAPPRQPHGEAQVAPDEEPLPPEQTRPPYQPYAGDRTVTHIDNQEAAPAPYRLSGNQINDAVTVTPRQILGPDRQLPANTSPSAPPLKQPLKATTLQAQTSEVLKKAGVQQALKDAGVAAPSATVRPIRPGIEVGPTLKPRMDLTFYGDKTGEGASLMQLTRYNINELRAMAVQRGLDVAPGETHVQLIEKIHDDLSPAEIKEFSDAAAERGRFSPPARVKRGAQPQATVQPQAQEPPASAPATPPMSLAEQARDSFNARRAAPSEPLAPKVDTSKTVQTMQAGQTVEGNYGSDTAVKTTTGSLPAKYKVVEADSLIPSHNAQTFAKNPQYPEGVQERAYHTSKEAQARVIQQAQNYDPAYTVNTNPDAVNGPPVVTKDGIVLGGNSRTMSTQRLYKAGGGDAYRADLSKNAAQFGVSPEQIAGMKNPVLVREVETPANIEEARRIGADLNKNMTGAMGTAERAVSAGRSVKPDTLASISGMVNDMGEGATLRDALRQNGREVLSKLVNDGVISERERPQYADNATGGLNEEGKTFVERALVGSVVDDPRLMDTVPKSVLGKLEGSLGELATVGARTDEYNLLPLVRDALQEHAEIASRGLDVETHLAQTGMFGPERNPAVDALVRALAEKPKTFRSAVKQYAQDAKYDVQGQGALSLGQKPSAAKAFNDAFGTKLSEDQFHDALLQSLKKEGTIGGHGQEITNPAADGSLRENAAPATRPSPAGRATETAAPQSVNPPDRRTNLDYRQAIDAMSPEEQVEALYQSEKTGLPNKRAFEWAEKTRGPAKAIGMSDADGLKAMNDRYGYAAGDALLKAKADALQEAGLEAYHDKGDEFMFRGDSPEDLTKKLAQAKENLRNRVIRFTGPDGKIHEFTGADFSSGVGSDLSSAEAGLKANKASRKASGESGERGQMGNIREIKKK